jgi:hypothetical protein
MKKAYFMLLLTGTLGYSQSFTTGTVNLGNSPITAKIDTDATKVTLTLTAPVGIWFGIGFGGTMMTTAKDMFIWSSAANRDYTSIDQEEPTVDTGGVGGQSWTVNDTPGATTRTIVATRPLASTGDYTFLNNNSNIPIIYAYGTTTTLGFHGKSRIGALPLSRTTTLGIEDFSLNAASISPVPSKGNFRIKSKTGINKIEIYSQTGALVKGINVDTSSNNEVFVDGLSSGVYLMKLQNENDSSWKKVIVE